MKTKLLIATAAVAGVLLVAGAAQARNDGTSVGAAMTGAPNTAAMTMTKLDTNNDGQVSRSEFLALNAKGSMEFGKIDTDRNGSLNEAELNNAQETAADVNTHTTGNTKGDASDTH